MKYITTILGLFFALSLNAQLENIEMNFEVNNSPVACSTTAEACWDIQIRKLDGADRWLDGINIRLFFDEADMTYSSISVNTDEFGGLEGDTDIVTTPFSVDLGYDMPRYFRYNINGAPRANDPKEITGTFATIATVCFEANTADLPELCTSMNWDKNRDDLTVGIDGQNEGVTVVSTDRNNSKQELENVVNYNWSYTSGNTGVENFVACIETECPFGSISGQVTEDTDNTPDAIGDSPLSGVVIELLDSDGDPVLGLDGNPVTTTTDGNGDYMFENVPPGDYQVAEQDPDGYFSSSDSDGDDPNIIGNVRPIIVVDGVESADNDFVDRQNILPVELLSFTAIQNGTVSDLEWATAAEINNSHFEIERSTDGSTYTQIGKVEGMGNSSEVVKYNFTDERPENGVNYYRLRQVDYDGSSSYSNVEKVEFERKESLAGKNVEMRYFPNPVSSSLQFEQVSGDIIESGAYFRVIDSKGADVMKIGYSQSNQIDVSELVPGVYMIQLIDGNNSIVSTERVVKVK